MVARGAPQQFGDADHSLTSGIVDLQRQPVTLRRGGRRRHRSSVVRGEDPRQGSVRQEPRQLLGPGLPRGAQGGILGIVGGALRVPHEVDDARLSFPVRPPLILPTPGAGKEEDSESPCQRPQGPTTRPSHSSPPHDPWVSRASTRARRPATASLSSFDP